MSNAAMLDELVRRLPEPPPTDQATGMALLRELVKGEPVAIARLAEALGAPVMTAEAFVRKSSLSPLVHADESGRIVGFWGLSVNRTRHQITIAGRTLWTWCAMDTLLYAELLGETVEIATRDPETERLIRLTASPAGVETTNPTSIAVSTVRPVAADVSSNARLQASACHFIYFFDSRASAERWQMKHPETVLVSLDEAFGFARLANARLFGAELARRQAHAA